MKCDLTTGSSAHISRVVSGSAQTCFDDQALDIPCDVDGKLIYVNRSSLEFHGR